MIFKLSHIFRGLVPFLIFLTIGGLSASAYPASYYKSESILSSGHWVKITVDGEGIFQVTYDELRAWGFSEPEKVSVYGYSGCADVSGSFTDTHVDDLPQTACLHTSDGRILFYGEGDYRIWPTSYQAAEIARNYYDRRGVYFLTDSQEIKPVPTTTYATSSRTPYRAHYCLQLIENEAYNPGRGGAFFFDTPMAKGESRSFTFHVKDFDTSGDPGAQFSGVFRYEFIQNSTTRSHLTTTAPSNCTISYITDSDALANSNPAIIYRTNGYGLAQFKPLSDDPNSLQDEDITFVVTNPAESDATLTCIDNARLSYPRTSRMADERQLIMHYYAASPKNQRVEIADCPEDVVVWNIDNTFNITKYQKFYPYANSNSIIRVSLPKIYNSTTEACRIIAFTPSAQHPGVNFAGDVANTNIHGDETPEMVIITTAELESSARDLARFHEEFQGMKVNVYTQENIFNEFSSGTFSPMAYRRMAKMFYDREPDVFKYLLLYGGAHWDNRCVTGKKGEFLVTFQTDLIDYARNAHMNYASDQVYGMLADNYDPKNIHKTPTQIVVGRMNLSTYAQAQSANAKIMNFMKNPPSAANYMRATLSCDQGNNNVHFQQAEEIGEALREGIPGATLTRAYVPLYNTVNGITDAHGVLMSALRRGQGFFGYNGHGTPSLITGVKLLDIGQVNNEVFNDPTFVFFSSCDLFSLDRSPSLVDALLSAQHGGVIGGVGASRSVYLEHNQDIFLAVTRRYASALPGTTYGEIYAKGRNDMLLNPDLTNEKAVNTMAYNYAGDPAVLIPVPAYTIVIDEVNGQPYSETSPMSLQPLSKATISGHIVSRDGKGSTSLFNGNGLVELYDSPQTSKEIDVIVSKPEKPNETMPAKATTQIDNTVISENVFEVNGGRFEATIVVPESEEAGVQNRLLFTATDDVTGDRAAGAALALNISALDEDHQSELDAAAPRIVEFYIDTPDFRSGDVVNPTSKAYAVIEVPESGLNRTERGIGHAGRFILDGKRNISEIFNTAETTADGHCILTLDLEDLNDGRHSLELNITNNFDAPASGRIDFCVLSEGLKGILSVQSELDDCDSTPIVRETADFDLSMATGHETEGRLVVQNSKGETVHSVANVTMPYSWNLRGSDGKPVADGSYTARVMLRSGSVFGGTEPVKFTVIRK